MTPQKGDVIQFKADCNPYTVGDRYEVHKVIGDRVYFYIDGPESRGYGSDTIDGWTHLKTRAAE
jgi:signal peptidase I